VYYKFHIAHKYAELDTSLMQYLYLTKHETVTANNHINKTVGLQTLMMSAEYYQLYSEKILHKLTITISI
jgi:hypothetical protein